MVHLQFPVVPIWDWCHSIRIQKIHRDLLSSEYRVLVSGIIMGSRMGGNGDHNFSCYGGPVSLLHVPGCWDILL